MNCGTFEIEVDTPRGPIRPVSGISLSIPKGKRSLAGESAAENDDRVTTAWLLPGNAWILSGTIRLVSIFFRSRKASWRAV